MAASRQLRAGAACLFASVLSAWPGVPVAAATSGADLSIAVSGPTQLEQGTYGSYLVSYANSGPQTATNAHVTITLDTQLFWDPFYVTGNCTDTTPQGMVKQFTFVCDVGTLAPGSSGSFKFAIQAWSSTPIGTYKAKFTIGADQVDPKQQNNAVPVHVSVVTPYHADVWTSIVRDYTNTTYPYTPGQTVWLDTQFGNGGPAVATNTVETFQLPASFSYDPANSDSRCMVGGQTVTCQLGSLIVTEATNDVIIAFTVGAGGTYQVTASITADQPDPVPANNTSTHTISVQG
jgi:Domain of unknown function DUF11